MKKVFNFIGAIAMSFLALSANAQSAITLDNTNITGQVKGTIHTHTATATGVSAPKTGANQAWNYSSLTGGAAVSTNLLSDTTFSTTSVMDTSSHENVVQTSPIKSFIVYDIDSKGYFTPGRMLPHQDYSDAIITGNPKDSTLWAAQSYKARQDIIAFPATMSSSWSSKTVHPLNSKINLTSFGITNASVDINVHNITKDSVVGWGTLQIPAGSKPSQAYNVLLVRHFTVSTDSFYLNGQLAPSFMLLAFHSKQNDTSTIDYSESFYRAGTGTPLLTLDFGYDGTYTTPTTVAYDADNVQSGIENAGLDPQDFKIFPNPAIAGVINCHLYKNVGTPWNLSVINTLGQCVKILKINGNDNLNMQLDMTGFGAGLYFVHVNDEYGNCLISSKLEIVN